MSTFAWYQLFFSPSLRKKKKDVPRPTACTKFMKYDVCMFFGKTITKNVAKCIRDVNAQCYAVHRGAFCQFPFRLNYYCHSSQSTGKEIGKTHLCAVFWKCMKIRNNKKSDKCILKLVFPLFTFHINIRCPENFHEKKICLKSVSH